MLTLLVRSSAVALATALAFAPAAQAQPAQTSSTDPPEIGLGIALVGGPPDAADGIGPGRAIYDAVPPGTTRSWKVRVANETDDPLPVDLFVVDAVLGDNGLMFSESPSVGPVSDWISFRPSSVQLAPRESVEVFVDISPGPEASKTEVLAAIVAQPPALEQGAIGVVQRVAVPVYLTTGTELALPDFDIATMRAGRMADGTPIVDVEAENTGERVLSIVGLLDLSNGPGGLSTDPVLSSNSVSVDVGARGVVRFLLDPALPSGPWEARATLSGGNIERAATTTLTFPDEPGTDAEPLSASPTDVPEELISNSGFEVDPERRVLLPIASFLILLALLMLFLLLWWQRRDDEEEDENAALSGVGHGDGDRGEPEHPR